MSTNHAITYINFKAPSDRPERPAFFSCPYSDAGADNRIDVGHLIPFFLIGLERAKTEKKPSAEPSIETTAWLVLRVLSSLARALGPAQKASASRKSGRIPVFSLGHAAMI